MLVRETKWSAEELVKIDGEALLSVNIPAAEKRYLAEVGLPRKAPMPLEGSFAILPVDISRPDSSTGGYQLFQKMPRPHYLAVGYFDFDEYFGAHKIFCINQRLGGIYSYDALDYPMRLVNHSIQRFSVSLYEYREFISTGCDISNLRALMKRLNRIDIRAMKDKSSYWYMLLDDLSENI